MNPNDPTPPNSDPLNTPPQTPPAEPVTPEPQPQPAPVESPATSPQPETTPASTSTPTSGVENPGKTLGIVSMILSIIGLGLVGVILALIGMSKSKKAGQKNGFALAGLIIGILNILAGIALFALVGYGGIQAAAELTAACAESANATVVLTNGTVVACE
ncbi:MAG TPA: hypothetical protein QF549_03830 [Candidatus Saccharimonadaceae bacterium]|nr:hypothetical protein [Candidatus Saccharimonadaceae bacterium]